MRGEVLPHWEGEEMDLMAPHRLAPEGCWVMHLGWLDLGQGSKPGKEAAELQDPRDPQDPQEMQQ